MLKIYIGVVMAFKIDSATRLITKVVKSEASTNTAREVIANKAINELNSGKLNKLSFKDKLEIFVKKRLGLFEVIKDGKGKDVEVGKFLTPCNLTVKNGNILVKKGAKVSGLYKADGFIEFDGKLNNGVLMAKGGVWAKESSELEGKIITPSVVYINGDIRKKGVEVLANGDVSFEYNAEHILNPKKYLEKLDGPLKIKTSRNVYINRELPEYSEITGKEIKFRPESTLENGFVKGDKVIMMGNQVGDAKIITKDLRFDDLPTKEEAEIIAKQNEEFLRRHE